MSNPAAPGAPSQIPRLAMSSEGQTLQRAHATWQENIGILYDVRLIGGVDESFSYDAEAFHLDDIVLIDYRCTAQNFDRSRSRIGRDGVDHFTLQLCLDGRHGPRDGGSEEAAIAGDLFIADLSQRHSTATSDFSCLNLTVPRRHLAPLLKSPDVQNLRRIRADMPLMALFRSHLLSLYQRVPSMRQQEAAAIVAPTLQLAAAAINATVDDENRGAVRTALASAIRRHIDLNILDETLSAERVAGAFGISTRKLYYLLEPHGGFAHYVQEERLRRCRRDLLDPACQHVSIAGIAARYGFTHRTSFFRAFRRLFQMTPREMRTLAAEGKGRAPYESERRHMMHWIRDLR